MSATSQRPTFEPTQALADPFLSLFPHRYDYVWADHPDPGERPQWQTESRHPLTDRLLHQGAHLYGVRFDPETGYFMLDLDANSAYHPNRDPLALKRILTALEQIGIVAHVAITSSHSGGLHLYFPFELPQKSYKISRVVQALLQNAGFKIKPGQLEIFPNARPYQEKLSLYNAHRLPLQLGSYLLNESLESIFTTPAEFVRRWTFAQQRNDLSPSAIEQIWKTANRHDYAISRNATKFLNDLNAEIEPGWTNFGQTNWILGKIADREFIFRHVLSGTQPLESEALIDAIVSVAQSLPGYRDYCRHQTDIRKRAQDWARHVEAQRYHYGGTQEKLLGTSPQSTPSLSTYHHLKAQDAQTRIQQALDDLTTKHELPDQITARERAIAAYGISSRTLRKYPALWHPAHQATLDHNPENSHEFDPPQNSLDPIQAEEPYNPALNKFMRVSACSCPSEALEQADLVTISSQGNFKEEDVEEKRLAPNDDPLLLPLPLARSCLPTSPRRLQQIETWLNSGDPILEAEARSRLSAVKIEVDTQTAEFPLPSLPKVLADPDRDEDVRSRLAILDLSDVLARIDCERVRLHWQPEALRQYCLDQYGQLRSSLTDDDLIHLLLTLRQMEPASSTLTHRVSDQTRVYREAPPTGRNCRI